MKIHDVEVHIHEFLSSTLVGDEWIAIRLGIFILLPMVHEHVFASDSICAFQRKKESLLKSNPCPSVVVSRALSLHSLICSVCHWLIWSLRKEVLEINPLRTKSVSFI